MKQFITVFKKELRMFFSNRRLLITSLLPGIIMVVFYIILSQTGGTKKYENETFSVGLVNNVEEYQEKLNSGQYSYDYKEYDCIEDAKTDLESGSLDLIIDFDTDFAAKIDSSLKPNLNLFYDAANEKSTFIYEHVYSIYFLDCSSIDYVYTLNLSTSADISDGKGQSVRIMAMLLPYMLLTVLFNGCANATTTVIAGEKERGTMSSLLVTPVKRTTICLGKLSALSIIALLTSAVSLLFSVLGTKIADNETIGINLSLYDGGSVFQTLAIVFVSVLFFTSVLACCSTYAKTVKEANGLSGALNILILLLAMTTITGFKPTNDLMFLIPFYNSAIALSGIFGMTLTTNQFVITLFSTIFYFFASVYVCKKMFDSEKIMLSKR